MEEQEKNALAERWKREDEEALRNNDKREVLTWGDRIDPDDFEHYSKLYGKPDRREPAPSQPDDLPGIWAYYDKEMLRLGFRAKPSDPEVMKLNSVIDLRLKKALREDDIQDRLKKRLKYRIKYYR